MNKNIDTKSHSEGSMQNKKRSIAHKLANNIRRQYSESKHGIDSNSFFSNQYLRRISKVDSDEEDVDNLFRDKLHSRSSKRPLKKNHSLNKFNIKSVNNKNYEDENNINNNSQSMTIVKDFKKHQSTNSLHKESQMSDAQEDSSEDVHYEVDYDSDMEDKKNSRVIRRNDKINKNNLSSLDLYGTNKRMERLTHRLDHLSLPPLENLPDHFNSTPNIATSKDFILNGARSPWSPMLRRHDDDDDAHSVQSSKMTSVSSVLSAVSTEKIRGRGYLANSTNLGLLGNDELSKLFPDRRMRCFMSTWNVGETKVVPPSLNDLLLPTISEMAFDVYVVALQEVTLDRHELCVKIQETLGPHFVLFHSASHGSLFIVIFMRRDLIWFLSTPEESVVTTRLGPSSIKTKGAVAIGFIMFGTSILVINSHFRAHEGNSEERIEDYKKISSSLNFSKIMKSKYLNRGDSSDTTSQFDCVFWLGDLNSRMEIRRDRLEAAMTTGELKEVEMILQFDELNRLRTQELVFKGFLEGKIRFPPTYKFDVGTNDYDSSNKNRNPSYTDRILFRSRKKGSISCLHYNSVPSFQQSDHKPVSGVFEVELRPGMDSMPLSGGHFNRDVWLAGTKRRMTHQIVTSKTESNSAVCLMM